MSTKKNVNVIVISSSIILGFLILGYFYRNIELRKIKLIEDSTTVEKKINEKEYLELENKVEKQENKTIEAEKTTSIQTKQKECDQVYTYLKSKYNNILSVTYSAKLNDCMISLPDETGKPIYVKLSESTFD